MRDENRNACEHSPEMGRIGDRPYWVLNLSILIRAAHQVGAAVFLAAYLIDALPDPSTFFVVLATASGVLLLGTEWLRHRQIFRETAGVITLVKVPLLGVAFHGFLPQWQTVLLVFVVASIGAHAPKKVRHRLLY